MDCTGLIDQQHQPMDFDNLCGFEAIFKTQVQIATKGVVSKSFSTANTGGDEVFGFGAATKQNTLVVTTRQGVEAIASPNNT